MGEIAKTGYLDEARLRQLAVELAKDIHSPQEILNSLGLSEDDYQAIKDTRAFRTMYLAASAEWNAAGNTQKRAKLKAAAMTEEVLPMFYADIEERKESLTARVALLNTIAKIGGLGQPEPALPGGGNHQFFKLEIHLQGRQEPIIIDGESVSSGSSFVNSDEQTLTASSEGSYGEEEARLTESHLAADEPYDQF